jgi:hypothetical protein
VWWYTTVIPALRRLRQEDPEFHLDCIARPYLQKKTKKKSKKLSKPKKNHSAL